MIKDIPTLLRNQAAALPREYEHEIAELLHAASLLEEAAHALEPFAKAQVSSAAVAMLGRDAQHLRCNAYTTLADFELARTAYSRIKGGDHE